MWQELWRYIHLWALLVSNWTHYNYRNIHLKFNSSLGLASLQMLHEDEDNNLTFLFQHPLNLWRKFLRKYCGNIKEIFVSFVQLHLYKVMRSRDTEVGTLTGLQAERRTNRGTNPGRGNWLACHCFCFVLFFVLSFFVHSTSLVTCVFRNLPLGC